MRQRKLGELRRLVTVSRPGICIRLAQLASKVNSSQWSDTYRIDDLPHAVKEWRMATGPEYRPGLHIGDGRTLHMGIKQK